MATTSLRKRKWVAWLILSLVVLFPLAGATWGYIIPEYIVAICIAAGFFSGICCSFFSYIDTDNPPYEEMIIYKCDYTMTPVGGHPSGCGQYYGKGYCEWLEDQKVKRQIGPSTFFVSDEDPGECFCNAVPYRLVRIWDKEERVDKVEISPFVEEEE